jgi:hypothetical protein
MMKKILFTVMVMCICILQAGTTLAANPLETLKTPAEKSNWERTTSSQEVIDYLTTVVQNGGGKMRLEFISRTAQGRLIPLLVIGNPLPEGPVDVPDDKAVVIINCNIHSGEVEGKEAMLIFAREVALGQHDDILKDLVILLNPNMSPDGNDRLGPWRRNTQFTPKAVGTRDNGQGFNINRDMTKLESYEGRAMVEVMNKWDPVIFIDAHATNGSFMQHAVTYNWGLHPDTDPDILKYNRGEFSRKAVGSESYLFNTLGRRAIPYGNFTNYTQRPSTTTWDTFEGFPRYTTNYAGLRNRLALLLEVYSYDDFKTRMETQYACIYGTLQTVAADKVKIKDLIAQADLRSLRRATDGIPSDETVALKTSTLDVLTEGDEGYVSPGGYVDVDSFEEDASGDITPEYTYDPDDGFRSGITYPPKKTYKMIYKGKFAVSDETPMGALYVIRPGSDKAAELLLRHGVEVKRVLEDVNVDSFEWFRIDTFEASSRLYEGHFMNTVSGEWLTSEDLTIPKNSYVVSTAQKSGSLAALLLEPRGEDGMVAWNVLDNQIFNESTGVNNGSDRFRNRAGPSNQWVVMPLWKLNSYNAIPDNIPMETLEGIPHDDTLPPPITYITHDEPITKLEGDNGGCLTGLAAAPILMIAGLALLYKRKRQA